MLVVFSQTSCEQQNAGINRSIDDRGSNSSFALTVAWVKRSQFSNAVSRSFPSFISNAAYLRQFTKYWRKCISSKMCPITENVTVVWLTWKCLIYLLQHFMKAYWEPRVFVVDIFGIAFSFSASPEDSPVHGSGHVSSYVIHPKFLNMMLELVARISSDGLTHGVSSCRGVGNRLVPLVFASQHLWMNSRLHCFCAYFVRLLFTRQCIDHSELIQPHARHVSDKMLYFWKSCRCSMKTNVIFNYFSLLLLSISSKYSPRWG